MVQVHLGPHMLPVERVRTLELVHEAGPTQRRYVAAASGLAIVNDTLYVVADDELYVAVFPRMGEDKGTVVRLLEGHLPANEDERQERKPDLESLTPLDAFDGFRYGGLIALGSGSNEHRDHGAFAVLGPDGEVTETFEIDARPLFAALRDRIPGLNLEGTAVVDDTFRVLQRGDKEEATPGHIDLDVRGLHAALSSRTPLGDDLVRDIATHDLGRLRGVDLCFSDADTLSDGNIVFSASAESSGEGPDGESVGSAVGLMSPDGAILRLEPIDVEVKVEGLAARSIDGRIEGFMVTDQDDPNVPSDLWRVVIPA
ncbi:MAG: hypothetical protein KY391_04250 [Actinobacteria bacterium]|nr:hypothetical protein [Actinomycetota bacterium]